MPIAALAAIGIGGSIAGGAIEGSAAKSAAQQQSQAAQQAAQLQYQASQNALDFQKQQWNTEQQEMQPWLQSGEGALSNLNYLMGIGGAPTSGAVPAFGPGSYGAPLNGGGASLTLPPSSTSPLTIQQPSYLSPTPAGPTGSTLPGGTAQGGMPFQKNAPVSAMSAASGAVPAIGPGSQNFGSVPGGTPAPTPPGMTGAAPTASSSMPAPNTSLGAYGSLMAANPYSTFTAPTAAEIEANDPGYQARLNLGEQALEHSAAARGGVLTGGTAQAENQYAQDYASNEYNNYYNQAFNTNAANYNAFAQNQANQYNRLASLAGMGQTTAGQLGTLGTEMSGQVGSNLLNTAGAMGQQYNNAAAANASGMVGSANAWGGALSGIGGNVSNLLMMQSILGGGSNPYQTLYNAQQYPSAANMPGLE